MIAAIFITGGVAFIPATFIIFVVYERSNRIKLMQYVGGLSPLIYWTSTLISDWVSL